MDALIETRKLPDAPVTYHPQIVSGVPVFENTRVPVEPL
jgi:uncharacterized protein (DUF433 family)